MTPQEEPQGASRLWALLACALAFVVYLAALRFTFVFDDRLQIIGNPWITSWRNLPTMFYRHVWYYTDPVGGGNYWRPLFLVWLLINYTFFKLQPLGYHLTSILTHVAVTWMVYRFGWHLTRDRVTAGIAALLFAVNPIHIEAVCWVSGITDPLMSLFFLASFVCWWRSRDEGRGWLVASLAFYAAAMLVKEPAVVLVAVIAVAAWLFAQDAKWKSAVREAVPFAVVAAVYLVLRALVIRGMAHPLGHESWAAMMMTWPSLLWFYARQMVFPVGLSGFYDVPFVHRPGLQNFVLPLLGLSVIAGGLCYWARRSGSAVVAFACWWMLIPILPVLYIRVFPAWDIAHDRYLYLPSVGFCLLVALGLRRIRENGRSFLGAPFKQAIFALAIAAAYCATCLPDQMVWADDMRLYRRGVAVAPENVLPKLDLAIFLFQDAHDYRRAVALLQDVVTRQPDFWEGNYDLGFSYYLLGNNEASETYLSRAIQIQPWKAAQYAYRSVARMKLGKLEQAAADAQHALALDPNAQRYHYAYGLILEKQGNYAAAADQFRAELKRDPSDKTVQEALARVEKEGR